MQVLDIWQELHSSCPKEAAAPGALPSLSVPLHLPPSNLDIALPQLLAGRGVTLQPKILTLVLGPMQRVGRS